MSSSNWQHFYLRVAADADPGVLGRVLEHFTNRNLVPQRVLAEWATTGVLHVKVVIAGIAEETINLSTSRLGQAPAFLMRLGLVSARRRRMSEAISCAAGAFDLSAA